MGTIEDRLRAATSAAADVVPDGRPAPLRLPEGEFRPVAARLRESRLHALAAPAAAAAAVAAIVAALVAVHAGRSNDPASQPVSPRVPPAFYVALTQINPGNGGWTHPPADAVVRATKTGATIASVSVPAPYQTFVAVSGAYDDRTFVLAAQRLPRASGTPLQPYPATGFYELRINPRAGGAARAVLTPLRVPVLPAGTRFGGLTLSPDGSRLAVTLQQTKGLSLRPVRSGYGRAYLRVYALATGRYQQWNGVIRLGFVSEYQQLLSWEGNGRFLSYVNAGTHCQYCVYRLDTLSAGGAISSHSIVLAQPPRQAHVSFISWDTAIVTPDGGHVLGSAFLFDLTGQGRAYMQIYRYSVRPGRIIARLAGPGNGEQVLWSSPDGRMLIACNHGKHQLAAAIYIGTRGTPLQLPAGTILAAW